MRAIAAKQHMTETREVERSFFNEATYMFEKRRVKIAAPMYDERGAPVTKLLDARIEVRPREAYRYHARVGSSGIGAFTSLHRAKNAIRRHFRIESRRLLIWQEA